MYVHIDIYIILYIYIYIYRIVPTASLAAPKSRSARILRVVLKGDREVMMDVITLIPRP